MSNNLRQIGKIFKAHGLRGYVKIYSNLDLIQFINPDDFMIYGFKALIKRRKAIFDSISKNWGISLNFENLRVVKSAADLVKAIQFEIASKIQS